MKAILLAAGKGTRISRMIEQIPKSTLSINGVPLIRYTVDMLEKKGIKCGVCVGYEKDKVYAALEGCDIQYFVNPFFNVTNSIASLWFARDFIDDDMIIMNADVFISNEILDLVLEQPYDNVLTIDKTRIEIGDYFFKTTDSGNLKNYGKDLPLRERSGEYVGLAKIQKSFLPCFCERMNKMIDNLEHNKWWENILYSMTEETSINTVDINGLFWSEIDYFDDYERILNYIGMSHNKELDIQSL